MRTALLSKMRNDSAKVIVGSKSFCGVPPIHKSRSGACTRLLNIEPRGVDVRGSSKSYHKIRRAVD